MQEKNKKNKDLKSKNRSRFHETAVLVRNIFFQILSIWYDAVPNFAVLPIKHE